MDQTTIEQTIKQLRFDDKGLVTAVVQAVDTQAVLMVAHMNEQAVKATLQTGFAHYYSRSRRQLWKKGETSGHVQRVHGFNIDCDGDAILLQVTQTGVACHTLAESCFHTPVLATQTGLNLPILTRLYETITARKNTPEAGSYTQYLFDQGLDKMLKKVGEEAAEVIIAAKNPQSAPLEAEIADLFYHVYVLMVERQISEEAVFNVLEERRGKRRA